MRSQHLWRTHKEEKSELAAREKRKERTWSEREEKRPSSDDAWLRHVTKTYPILVRAHECPRGAVFVWGRGQGPCGGLTLTQRPRGVTRQHRAVLENGGKCKRLVGVTCSVINPAINPAMSQSIAASHRYFGELSKPFVGICVRTMRWIIAQKTRSQQKLG